MRLNECNEWGLINLSCYLVKVWDSSTVFGIQTGSVGRKIWETPSYCYIEICVFHIISSIKHGLPESSFTGPWSQLSGWM